VPYFHITVKNLNTFEWHIKILKKYKTAVGVAPDDGHEDA
jgi:hypothetical protein